VYGLLLALGAVAALVLLIAAVRAARWYYLARSPVVVWTAGSVSSVSVDAFDILWYSAWYSALLDPRRLAETAHALAQNWARRRAARALLGTMHHMVHRLRADMASPDVLPGSGGAIHSEIATALYHSLNGLGSAAGHMHEHLAGWMDHVRGHPHATHAVIDAAHHGTVHVPDVPDAVSSAVVGSSLILARQVYKVYEGDKTAAEAVKDGGIEAVVKWAAGATAGVIVVGAIAVTTGAYIPGAGKAASLAARVAAGEGLKWCYRTELRSLKKVLLSSVAAVGAELYTGGRRQRLRHEIWAPHRRNQRAVAVLSCTVQHSRREIAFWIWPSPRHVMYVLAERRGRQAERASHREAWTMDQNLTRIEMAGDNRNVLAGKLLIGSPWLQAELAISEHLVRQANAAHDDVLAEKERLRRRYG
jgi:hypothetical protein